MKSAKTTKQIYEQQKRVSDLLHQVTVQAVKRADATTNGNIHLAHNWGNEEAVKELDRYYERMIKLNRIQDRLYKQAFAREYPGHLMAKQYANA